MRHIHGKKYRGNVDCWTIKLEAVARKQLKKFDKETARSIQNYINKKVIHSPRSKGKALTGKKRGLWRYRVGKYRILCRIRDSILTVIVIEIGNRDSVYDD